MTDTSSFSGPAGEHPFHASNWPRAILRPEDADGSAALSLSWDLTEMSTKEKKQLIADWCDALPQLAHVRRLKLWSMATQPLLDAIGRMTGLECLIIKGTNASSFEALRRLPSLRYLSIGSSTKVDSVEPLAALTTLKILELENLKKVSDFSPLVALTGLESLAVEGAMWARQEVQSLAPFAAMVWLQSLALDTSDLESVRPLASLKGLKSLGIGGRLPMEEYAWLAARLPHTQCRWFAPYVPLSLSGIGKCARCGQQTMVMLTGRRAGNACLACDKARVDKHVAAFDAARASACV